MNGNSENGFPPQSPDLHLIENLWCIMKSCVNKREPPVSTKDTLKHVLVDEWERFTPDDFNRLFEFKQKQVRECNKDRGGSMHY